MTRMLHLIPAGSTTIPARTIFDRFFDGLGLSLSEEEKRTWSPAFDVAENDTEYLLSAELPGIEQKDLDVTISKGILTVKGEKRRDSEDNGENYHRLERYYGSFERRFSVPDNVLTDKVEATYKNGVLKLALPKASETTARKINISKN